jgi:hypothetical protein
VIEIEIILIVIATLLLGIFVRTIIALAAIVAAFLLLALAGPALAQPLPHPKTGQCSGGYVQSGGYCVPKSARSAPTVPKVGQCPAGWRSGASTCEKMR